MQIYYFTRSGRSKKIAETLAVQYQTTAKCIDLVGQSISAPHDL